MSEIPSDEFLTWTGDRIALALARAALGAFVGCLIALPVAGFISSFLRDAEHHGPGDEYGVLFASLPVGAVLGAAFGVIIGGREIRGRAGTTVQGVLYGVIIGIGAGAQVWFGLDTPLAEHAFVIGGVWAARGRHRRMEEAPEREVVPRNRNA